MPRYGRKPQSPQIVSREVGRLLTMLRFILLGLLRAEPCYGYELKTVFERFMGGTWPLNIGQVYGALNKLEDDGFVECEVVPQDDAPDRKVFSITHAGTAALDRWLGEPDTGPVRLRDDYFMKVLVASIASPALAGALITQQRAAHFRSLAEIDDAQRDPDLHPATALLLEGAALRLEADLKWLDRCAADVKGLT